VTNRVLKPIHTLVLLVFILSLCFVIVLAVLNGNFFKIKEIEVKGVNKVTSKEVIKRSELIVGESTIFFLEGLVKKRIKASPLISDVIIKRHFPNKVTIEVYEAIPSWLVIGEDGQFYYMSDKGNRLRRANTDDGFDYPVLFGEGVLNPTLLEMALEINRLAKVSEVISLQDISEIHLDVNYGVSILTMDTRKIDFGMGNITEKWYKMEKIIKYARGINLKESYINISSEKQGIVDFKL